MTMKYMTINNRKVAFDDNDKNVLSVIRKCGIDLPTFCYHSELSTYGACRMCVVEDERGRMFASCSEIPQDGMVIYTNTTRLQKRRKMILELLLASHERECTTCVVGASCTLQKLSRQMGVSEVRFENTNPHLEIDSSSPSIVIDHNKCILCGDCVRTCEEIQGMGILNFANRGSKTIVTPAFGRKISETDCVGCGQCRIVCPTAAITIKHDTQPVWEALGDPNVRVVAQIAPAVRVAIGDKFGIPHGENALGKLVNGLRLMGFDEVYDTNFGADLTVMEESKEFVERLESGENLPLFTSCCPAWVKFVENKYPDLARHVSSCRSPMQMLSAVLKEEARQKKQKTMVVAIMPCTAKKGEILRTDGITRGDQVTDYVLTTTEVTRMLHTAGIDLSKLQGEALDMPFGLASGGAAIFGVTGGVTEAVLRKMTGTVTGEELHTIATTGVRGEESIRTFSVDYKGREVRIAVVNGLAAADRLMKQIQSGEAQFDFVEVMACRQGCIGGGGQPVPLSANGKMERKAGMYRIDDNSQIKNSGENPIITMLYDGILKNQVHTLLHRPNTEE